MPRKPLLTAAAIWLAACDDGSSGSDTLAAALCQPMGGGGASASTPLFSTTCGYNCQIENMPAAVDGDPDSFASMNLGGIKADGALRGTAQNGLVFPAGTVAGALVTEPAFTLSGTVQITVNTYLNGAPRGSELVYAKSVPSGYQDCHSCERTADGRLFFGAYSTLDFNEIEITVTQSGGNNSSTVRVYEFCTRTE